MVAEIKQTPGSTLEDSIFRATDSLLADQKDDGHWIYEFETDMWGSAEFVLLAHYLGETPDHDLEQKIARYIRRNQLPGGGWNLFTDGKVDVSVSVKAYFALKMIGDSPNAEHMLRAKQAILAAGGAEASSVFTRILLALFGIVSWSAVPMMPVEIMLLPEWFPFHILKVSYWSRVVLVPQLVLNVKRPLARNPRGVRVDELFRSSPSSVGLPAREPYQSKGWYYFFLLVDYVLRFVDPFVPTWLRKRGIDAALKFVDQRMNGEDGIGGFLFAAITSVIMYDALGYSDDYPNRKLARESMKKKVTIHSDEAYLQLNRSPVWDTTISALALLETGDNRCTAAAQRGLEWLIPHQIVDVRGDWSARRPNLRPGGWAFQYVNPYYPDVDDTAVIVMTMYRLDDVNGSAIFAESIARGREWVVGMQSSNGGWSAFEPENTHFYLNNIPFSDRGALVDPPTADVTSRCLSMLVQLGEPPSESEVSRRACKFVLKEQESNGSWFGQWGVNYIWGTWSALSALNAAGLPHEDARIQRAVRWLVSIQNEDGGWGESNTSYDLDYRGHEPASSTSSQTSWALLGLMAAGEVNHPAVARGIAWLLETQCDHGFWEETAYTGSAFPGLLHIRYHGYCKYFPLWALARYRNLKRDGLTRVSFGV